MKTHEDHIRYDHFKAAGLPIGSGLVESACKWLIQQCFKGVGMRWSEVLINPCSGISSTPQPLRSKFR
jgi:hypothetical protein